VLVAVGVLAVSATTSVFAFHNGFTQSTTTNPGPLNTGVTVTTPGGSNAITPGQAASVASAYSYTASAPAGNSAAANNTTIGTMYQQWRHNTLTDRWFYLYAGNTNAQGTQAQQFSASMSSPTFAYYYYTRDFGQRAFLPASLAAGTSASGGTPPGGPGVIVSSASAGVNGIIWLDSGATVPIATVRAMVANVPSCTGGATARCGASLVTNVRWGLAQEGFPAGTVSLLEAVESVPLSTTGTATIGVPVISGTGAPAGGASGTYADPWGSNGGAATLTLTDSAPVQAASGVGNVGSVGSPGARFTSTAYGFQQTITDTNGDLLSGSLVFVYSSGSGANTGQWFRVGYVNGDDSNNTPTVGAGNSCEYESWNEAVRKSVGCTAISGNYVNSYSATATGTTGSGAGEVITHTVNFSPTATGTVVVYGRAEDFHGMTSGNVQVGAISISLLPE